jgi:hypothetical protein
MRQKSLIAALLLPLPFAALPVLAVFVNHFGGDSQSSHLTVNPVPIERQIEQLQPTGHALAHNVADPSSGCLGDALPPVEG